MTLTMKEAFEIDALRRAERDWPTVVKLLREKLKTSTREQILIEKTRYVSRTSLDQLLDLTLDALIKEQE